MKAIVGKTIDNVDTSSVHTYIITFTDGSTLEIAAEIEYSPSGFKYFPILETWLYEQKS